MSSPVGTAATTPLVSRMEAGPGYAGEWGLFLDYTAATGQPALPTTVDALVGFLTVLPAHPSTLARRVRAIAAAHRRAGHLLDRPDRGPAGPPPAPARRRPDPGLMLAACPTRGWPHGFTGRRDGFLIVLTDILDHTASAARAVRPTDITTVAEPGGATGLQIAQRGVPVERDPRGCPTCAVARWLDVLGLADGLGRGSARTALAAAHAPTTASPHQHAPDSARWRGAPVLLPAVDRHGWHDDYRPMSTRAIRTRLALAADRAAVEAAPTRAPALELEVDGPVDVRDPGRPVPGLHEVLTLLDDLADDADALNARIEALLAG